MRFPIALVLVFGLFTAQAQHLSISIILSLTSCLDATCMGAFADSAGFCHKLGADEDGYLWFSCAHVFGDSLDEQHVTTIGFVREGYGNRIYSLGTRDTAYAQELTEELEQLHFKPVRQVHEGAFYRNPSFPGIEIARLEKRMTSIEPRRPDSPAVQPRPEPMDERERKMREEITKSHPDLGDFDLIPKISWVFKVILLPQ